MTATSVDKKRVLVLGGGNFGTALGQHLAVVGHDVVLWSTDEGVPEAINKTHKNPKYFKDITLSARLSATKTLSEKIMAGVSAVVVAIPTQAISEVLGNLRGMINNDMLIICAAKGIDIKSLLLPNQLIANVLGQEWLKKVCILSGPSFAVEIIEMLPTAVSMACETRELGEAAQNLFHAPHFRVYLSLDPTGLCVAGALKNVIAIASGAASGMGLQANSRAALLTRGLAEITRVGVAMGANPLTFNGLGGVGDLFLTCTSEKSRNFTVGYRLGRGEKLDDILKSSSVAEGVYTAKAIRKLARNLKVETPIADEVYEVLYEGKSIHQALESLLHREAREELDF